mmetsp:Transcript_37870/g.97725  ORF Transcript_37870/g.97725 Transcript_37870/m.97725 type:complete len:271 (-) Transcript_37870:469-1281(-)
MLPSRRLTFPAQSCWASTACRWEGATFAPSRSLMTTRSTLLASILVRWWRSITKVNARCLYRDTPEVHRASMETGERYGPSPCTPRRTSSPLVETTAPCACGTLKTARFSASNPSKSSAVPLRSAPMETWSRWERKTASSTCSTEKTCRRSSASRRRRGHRRYQISSSHPMAPTLQWVRTTTSSTSTRSGHTRRQGAAEGTAPTSLTSTGRLIRKSSGPTAERMSCCSGQLTVIKSSAPPRCAMKSGLRPHVCLAGMCKVCTRPARMVQT